MFQKNNIKDELASQNEAEKQKTAQNLVF